MFSGGSQWLNVHHRVLTRTWRMLSVRSSATLFSPSLMLSMLSATPSRPMCGQWWLPVRHSRVARRHSVPRAILMKMFQVEGTNVAPSLRPTSCHNCKTSLQIRKWIACSSLYRDSHSHSYSIDFDRSRWCDRFDLDRLDGFRVRARNTPRNRGGHPHPISMIISITISNTISIMNIPQTKDRTRRSCAAWRPTTDAWASRGRRTGRHPATAEDANGYPTTNDDRYARCLRWCSRPWAAATAPGPGSRAPRADARRSRAPCSWPRSRATRATPSWLARSSWRSGTEGALPPLGCESGRVSAWAWGSRCRVARRRSSTIVRIEEAQVRVQMRQEEGHRGGPLELTSSLTYSLTVAGSNACGLGYLVR